MLAETIPYEPPVPEYLSDGEMLLASRQLPRHFAKVVMLADVYEFSGKEIQEALNRTTHLSELSTWAGSSSAWLSLLMKSRVRTTGDGYRLIRLLYCLSCMILLREYWPGGMPTIRLKCREK